MRLEDVRIVRSPVNEDRMRLCGEVSYKTCKPFREVYWFDVNERTAAFFSTSGNPWLACLLPVAAAIGEPLEISRPVDATLYEGAQELLEIWKCWYPDLHVVPLNVEPAPATVKPGPTKVASFFSGGVDSFFTVLRQAEVHAEPINDLLCVWGIDLPVTNPDAFTRWHASLSQAATALQKPLIDVTTNLKQTLFGKRTFLAELSQGCALASVALALEKNYRRVLIGSSGSYRNLEPWGSHPLTDRLLSTSTTKIRQDGAGHTRFEKLGYVAQSQIALNTLRVCFQSMSEKNCGKCDKCLRTMLMLELKGALRRCQTLPDATDCRLVERVYCSDASQRRHFEQIHSQALAIGREDITRAVRRSLRRSMFIDKVRVLREQLQGLPLVSWFADRIEEMLVRRSVCALSLIRARVPGLPVHSRAGRA